MGMVEWFLFGGLIASGLLATVLGERLRDSTAKIYELMADLRKVIKERDELARGVESMVREIQRLRLVVQEQSDQLKAAEARVDALKAAMRKPNR